MMVSHRRHRRSRGDAMDDYLHSLGLSRKQIPHDDCSLFRASAEQIYSTQALHEELAVAVRNYLERHKDEQKYAGLRDEDKYIKVMSNLYQHDFILFREVNKPPENVTNHGYQRRVVLCESFGAHFDSVYFRDHQNKAAICQSIVYDILYKNVLNTPPQEVDASVELLRRRSLERRQPLVLRQNEMSNSFDYGSPRTKWEDIVRRQSQTGPPFPYKVAKALDPVIYRNVELDQWIENRKANFREQMSLESSMKFSPGTPCLYHTTDENGTDCTYHAFVQQVTGENDPINVFVEELGEYRLITQDKLQKIETNVSGDRKNSPKNKSPASHSRQPEGTISNSSKPVTILKSRPRYDESRQASPILMPRGFSGFSLPPPPPPPAPMVPLNTSPVTTNWPLMSTPPPLSFPPLQPSMSPPIDRPPSATAVMIPVFPMLTVPYFDNGSVLPINFGVFPSQDINGSDLPNDLMTLRYFFNMGCEYFRQYHIYQMQQCGNMLSRLSISNVTQSSTMMMSSPMLQNFLPTPAVAITPGNSPVQGSHCGIPQDPGSLESLPPPCFSQLCPTESVTLYPNQLI